MIRPVHKIVTPTIVDPGCGTGVWIDSTRKAYKNTPVYFYAIDLEPNVVNSLDIEIHKTNYLSWRPSSMTIDLVAGNPPFNQAEEFVTHSLHMCRDGGYVFFLLRLAYLKRLGN